MKMIVRDEPCPPPPELPKELHHAFAAMCERLEHSGVDLSPQDLAIVSHVVQAEASLERAKAEAAQSPLTVDSRANGLTINPVHRLVATSEANLRAWLRLLPKPGGGRGVPLPHVSPVAGDAGAAAPAGAAAEPAGEPSARLQKLRAIIAQFAADQASAGAAAGVAVC